MTYENLIVEIGDDFVGEITLNRPEQLNTFNTPLAGELSAGTAGKRDFTINFDPLSLLGFQHTLRGKKRIVAVRLISIQIQPVTESPGPSSNFLEPEDAVIDISYVFLSQCGHTTKESERCEYKSCEPRVQ